MKVIRHDKPEHIPYEEIIGIKKSGVFYMDQKGELYATFFQTFTGEIELVHFKTEPDGLIGMYTYVAKRFKGYRFKRINPQKVKLIIEA